VTFHKWLNAIGIWKNACSKSPKTPSDLEQALFIFFFYLSLLKNLIYFWSSIPLRCATLHDFLQNIIINNECVTIAKRSKSFQVTRIDSTSRVGNDLKLIATSYKQTKKHDYNIFVLQDCYVSILGEINLKGQPFTW